MGKQLYLNNFDTLIIAAVKSSPSTGSPNTELDYGILRVAAGAAGALGTLSNGDYYILTAYKKSGTVESNREIWRVTYIDTSVINETRLTVSRAQEGTTAQSFVAGDYVSMRLTTGGLSNLLQRGGDTLSGALNGAPAVTIASGTNTDIGAAGSNGVTISGTTTITGLGSIAAGARRWVTFSGALVITHNATSLILPGAANITTVAGDCAEFVSLGSGNWKCTGYTKATVTGTGSTVLSDSPALAGTPTAPTAAAGTNTTQLATTAHVVAERSASRALTNLTGLTVASGGASISGNVLVTGDSSATGTIYSSTRGTSAGFQLPDWLVYNTSSGNALVWNNGSDRMTLDASGNLDMTAGGHIGRTATASGIFFNTNSILPSTGTGATDNTVSFGSASYRWTTIYATTGAINTSDARAKTKVRTLADAEIEAAIEHSKEIGIFQWLDAVAKKGEKARHHIGMTVQRSIEIMEKHGLDPMSYAFICHDVWADEFKEHPAIDAVEAKAAVLDDAGNEVEPAIEAVEGKDAWTEQTQTAGDRYAFRYDQLNLFIARGIEARLAALEARA